MNIHCFFFSCSRNKNKWSGSKGCYHQCSYTFLCLLTYNLLHRDNGNFQESWHTSGHNFQTLHTHCNLSTWKYSKKGGRFYLYSKHGEQKPIQNIYIKTLKQEHPMRYIVPTLVCQGPSFYLKIWIKRGITPKLQLSKLCPLSCNCTL